MSVQDTTTELWGGETRKAVDNFPVSGERVPVHGRALAGPHQGRRRARRTPSSACSTPTSPQRIAAAGDEIAEGKHDDQFPIDVFQTGSGTSSNMNANEVIANLAGEGAHPNDHVNMGQSSNDVFPSAVHLAALDEATNALLPALEQLEGSLARQGRGVQGHRQVRPHAPDGRGAGHARPGVRAATPRRSGSARARVAQRAAAGRADPARRHRHRHRPQHPPRVRRARCASGSRPTPASTIRAPEDPFEAQGNRDALVELSGALKVVAVSLTKIANDLALMGSGPRAGIGEIFLPELQKGSSIMPGKVNPVIPEVVLQVAAQVIGNDTAITIGGMQGQFELNVRIPLIARNLLQSIELLSNASTLLFAEKCVDGIEANLRGLRGAPPRARSPSPPRSTRSSATTRRPRSSRTASASGRTLREVAREHGVDEETLDKALDLRKIAAGSKADA